MKNNLNLGVIGIDHGHIFDMLDEMLKEGCTCDYFWTEGSPLTLDEFNKKYPNIKRVGNKSDILNDSKIDMILISSIPKDRASHSIDSLNSGKDVMVDKPGCTTFRSTRRFKKYSKKNRKNLVGKFFRTISCSSCS
jgi:predicted dehydrogenase